MSLRRNQRKMDKFKHQALVLAIAMLLGGVASGIFFNIEKNKEIDKLNEAHKIELEKQIRESLEVIESRNALIIEMYKITKSDSIKIVDLQKKIEQDGVRVEGRLNEARNFTNDEKVKYLIDRYSPNP